MTPSTIFLTALAIIVARITWATVTIDRRVRARAMRRAQRALKGVRDGE
jgi:preprotein translocase subunit SecY